VGGTIDRWLRQPLLTEEGAAANRWPRRFLLLAWLAVTAWLAFNHVPWRDEARAWSLMLMAKDWPDLFRVVHGEGHPYLWYIILKAGHSLSGAKEVLQVAGFVIGAAAAALLILRGPFRLLPLALMAFSLWLGFEYVVLARNYGIAALLMFAIAALWPRIRDTLWLGVLLLLLANTNVPSVFLAGAFVLYRMLEIWSANRDLRSGEWRRWAANAALLLLGTVLCFLAVYPPANDAAAAANALPLTAMNLLAALATAYRSFIQVGFGDFSPMGVILVWLSVLVFARRTPALVAALAALICLRLFFFMVYPGYYRHSALFFAFMIALVWIEAPKPTTEGERQSLLPLVGSWALFVLVAMQSVLYVIAPISNAVAGKPFSHAADLARLLDRPEYRGSLLMVEPDTMGESVAYQTGRPNWLIRQDRLGTVTPLANSGNKLLTLDRLADQAAAVHARTDKPVLIAINLPIDRLPPGKYDLMYRDYTILTPDSVARFEARTRRIASLRNSGGDESYDVYVYPR
jgi:hypothetical protein